MYTADYVQCAETGQTFSIYLSFAIHTTQVVNFSTQHQTLLIERVEEILHDVEMKGWCQQPPSRLPFGT